jgi:CO dehydrogenase/acetyl-CoA synthase gamma subunit (corrinoid Fe-S protein)
MEQEPSELIEVDRSVLVIPGLAESEKNAIRQLTRWEVLVGPISGFLTPLFLLQNNLWFVAKTKK